MYREREGERDSYHLGAPRCYQIRITISNDQLKNKTPELNK